jgi:hypothetical protein
MEATVHIDRRLCVPRDAFEAFVHATGQPLVGGGSVHITFNGNQASITLQPTPNSKSYSLSIGKGRIFFPAPPGQAPLVAGTTYKIQVSPTELIIDLDDPQ